MRRLKEEPARKGIWLCGGGIPVIDGGYDPGDFELVESTRYRSGVLVNEYSRSR